MKGIFKNYIRSVNHFYSLAKKEFALLIFLVAAIVSQIIFGLYLFDNFALSIGYSLGLFLFVSIAYSIIFMLSDKPPKKNDKNSLQLVIVSGAVALNFLILSGQFSKESHLFRISEPVRKFFFGILERFGFSPTINSIIINNLTAVFIPILLLMLLKKIDIKAGFKKPELKIITLLFLLYLPIILFGEKSLEQVIYYLPVYLFIAAIPEEILFRGLLQTKLENRFGKPVNAIILASIIFGLMHLPVNIKMYGNLVGVASCIGNNAFGGLLIGYLYHRTRSIETAILFHLISGIALS